MEMTQISLNVNNFLEQLESCIHESRPLMVGLSGGIDSVVLLHLCWQTRILYPSLSLAALHIHHGLSQNGDQWSDFCEQLCQQWQIPLYIHRVKVLTPARSSLEEQARKVRYQWFEYYAKQGYDIVLAHHQNDQSETFLLNLKRGSGVAGLAAMPARRDLTDDIRSGALLRPLLHFNRQQIENYAQLAQLEHIEDESNWDTRFDRNFLRQQIIPMLEQRWPQFTQQVAQSCHWLAQSQQLHLELAELDMARYVNQSGQLHDEFLVLSLPRQSNLLRFWLYRQSGAYPSYTQVQQLLAQQQAQWDRQPAIAINGGWVRRYDHHWSWSYPLNERPDTQLWSAPFPELTWPELKVKTTGTGNLRQPLANEQVSIRFRHELAGSMVMHPAGRGGSRSLKKLLQELRIPPWLRDYVPLVFYNECWVALADQVVDEHFIAQESDSWGISWQVIGHDLP